MQKIAQQDIMMERYAIIYPLLNKDLDVEERTQIRRTISEREGISVRTLYRWEERYRKNPDNGLIPLQKGYGFKSRLPDNFNALLAEAEDMKRELPSRSVAKIIRTMELNGTVEKGVLNRSTLQRYFQRDGCTKRVLTMKKAEGTNAARRFCKEHRMDLVQTDIKYSYAIPATRYSPERVMYLSTLLDDHSRNALHSRWYENQKQEIVEESIRRTILRYGRCDRIYADNGGQYISDHLKKALDILRIKLIHTPVRSGASKGKVEKFHQVVDSFLAEAKLEKITTVEEMNRRWEEYRKAYYDDVPHSGIAEYYHVNQLPFPEEGRTPVQEFNQDSRPLEYIDADKISIAFRHTEERVVTNGGIVKVRGRTYGAPAELRGKTVRVIFDPMVTDSITIVDSYGKEIKASLATIGPYVGDWSKPEPTVAPTAKGSRFLDAAEKYCAEQAKLKADALSFAGYGESEDSNAK